MSGVGRVIRAKRADWSEYEKRIRYWAKRFGYNPDDAVQEAAVSVWNQPAKYFVIDLVRFEYKEPSSRYRGAEFDANRSGDGGTLSDDPRRSLDVAHVLSRLPPRDSDLLQRFFIRGESANEIARSQGLNYDQIHYALEVALKKAARLMREK